MQDLSRLTRADLIKRVRALEAGRIAIRRPREKRSADRRAGNYKSPVRSESEERLRAILQTAVEGIITIDERGGIESLNPAAERMFGYPANELVGRNVSMLMPSPHQEAHDTYISNYLRTGRARIIGIGREIVGRRKDGSVFPIDLSVSEVQLAGRRLFTGFVRDITERKELEQAILRVSEAGQQHLGQDLHDGICQQLSGIELMCQVLESNLTRNASPEAGQAARITKYVRAAVSETRRLSRGLSPLSLEAEGLPAALGELAALSEEMFAVRCRCRCRVSEPIRDVFTATHVYRIAQEAVNNAIRHGRPGRILIQLKQNRGSVLTVTDDGRGISRNAKPGQGMGLRIMQHRAGLIGGTLKVERNPKGGTRVICTLPATGPGTRTRASR